MPCEFETEAETRYVALYTGVVADNVDPEKLARVRVTVPGLLEPSGWAWPVGVMGGGTTQRGWWDPPDINAEVGVWMRQGDPDHVYYVPSNWGRGEQPTPIADLSPADAVKVKCYETSRWLMVFDCREGGVGSWSILDKETGNTVKFDAAGLTLKHDTKVTIDAPAVDLGAAAGLTSPMHGILNGEAIDAFTGKPHWQLGNASMVVRAKKV
jgi:hypothetical protein